MNISILLGKGLEGCGVTKYALEMADYLKGKHAYKIYAVNDKKFIRDNAHDFSEHSENMMVIKSKHTDKVKQMTEEIKQSDALIILSFPTKSYEEESINVIRELINDVKPHTKLVYTHHNHSSMFLSKEVLIEEVIDDLDLVFTHSDVNPLNRYLEKRYENMQNAENLKIFTINPSIDTEKFKQKYWKPISEINKKKVQWIGRTTPLKGYDQCMTLHEEFLKDAGFKTSMHGMDKGPAIIAFKQTWKDKYRFMDVKNILETDENICDVYGPYIQHEMMDEVSKAGFLLQFTKFKEKEFSKSYSLEFTHIEACCVGSIPVFRKEYGEQCISRVTGNPIIESDTGILFISDDNREEIFRKMLEINENDELREEMRNKAYSFIKSQSDSTVVFDEFFRVIEHENSNIKDINTSVKLTAFEQEEW